MDNYKYEIYYLGKPMLGDPYGLANLVFSQPYVSAESGGYSVIVTFDQPQTPADLGPLVKVELLTP